MSRIRILRPNVSKDEALEIFSSAGPAGYVQNKVFGRLQSVAEFYVPFRLFQVEISNRGNHQQKIFGLDAVSGALDLYEFETLPEMRDTIYLTTRNHAEATLKEDRAAEILVSKIQRMLYLRGFFRLHDLQIAADAVPGEFHVPYWVGFRGHGERARIIVLDGLRRRVEGAKVKNLLLDWLNTVHQDARA